MPGMLLIAVEVLMCAGIVLVFGTIVACFGHHVRLVDQNGWFVDSCFDFVVWALDNILALVDFVLFDFLVFVNLSDAEIRCFAVLETLVVCGHY